MSFSLKNIISYDIIVLTINKSLEVQLVMKKEIIGIRAVGVTIKDGKILVQRDGNEYALPGGTVEFGESTEETLKREHIEELGSDIKINRLLWTEETFWKSAEINHHVIAFYYLVDVLDDSYISQCDEFVSQKDNCNIMLGWIPIEEIKNITIYPTFLKEEINHLNESIKHFISRE